MTAPSCVLAYIYIYIYNKLDQKIYQNATVGGIFYSIP